jgi:hypothetical protein
MVTVVALPTIISPSAKFPVRLEILRTLLLLSQDLTRAVESELSPVITSLITKLPVPTPEPDADGAAIVIVGASVYPNPALLNLSPEIVPAALTTATAVAFAVERPDGEVEIETTGAVVY